MSTLLAEEAAMIDRPITAIFAGRKWRLPIEEAFDQVVACCQSSIRRISLSVWILRFCETSTVWPRVEILRIVFVGSISGDSDFAPNYRA